MADLTVKCTVCQALLDEEDLFCPNCGAEAPPNPAARPRNSRVSTCNFQCSHCGASMSYDASAGSLRCPFCGSTELDKQADAKVLSPDRVVPFVIEHGQAVEIMHRWLGRGFWRPNKLSQEALVVKMTAVYVPYWVFEAATHTHWTADTSQVPIGASASWYPMSGEHDGQHAGILIGASGALTPSETAALCPFDLAAGVPPDKVDLDNMIEEQFSVPRKYARPLARQALEALEANDCRQAYVPGNCRNMKVNLRIEGLTSEPVLLPVWIMAYRYRGQLYRFLVNGQTGEATGEAPTSWWKVGAAVGIAAAILLVILALAGRH